MPAERSKKFSLEGKRVWVAGHRGMVGSAVTRRLAREPCTVLTAARDALDLRDPKPVEAWLDKHKPDAIILAAARVGGILGNATQPADFLSDNLAIQSAVIDGAFKTDVRKLLFLGSSCIYPKHAPQPIPESALLTGPLEATNEAYAIAKIAGLKLCAAYREQYGCDFISAMPTNLYGPRDNFDLKTGHVLPALIHKTHLAKEAGAKKLVIWGTGQPRREFLHVDDCADALVFLMQHYSDHPPINVGTGVDMTILDLAQLVKRIVGYSGHIETDGSKPDGTPRKLLNVDRLKALGWFPTIQIEDGIISTHRWFLENIAGRPPSDSTPGTDGEKG